MKGKVIVTGGTGYIGSHTAVELIEKGFEVVIIDNLCNSQAFIIDRIEKITGIRPTFIKADLASIKEAHDAIKDHADAVGLIHFAALKSVSESVSKALHYYQNNNGSLLNILECMKTYNIPNLLFSSSCTVYGEPDVLPVTEETPQKQANTPYGITKQMGEQIIFDVVKSEEISAIALRYFNPIGAHDSALIGELPQGVPNNLMPYITQTAAGIREKLSVFGSDYNTPDGTAIRDYIHVVDLAKAHVIGIEKLVNQSTPHQYEIYNVGTGTGYSVLEVINSFERTSGLKLNYVLTDRREGDIEKIYAETSKANKVLGWKAEKTLDDMTRSHWAWEEKLKKN